MSKNPCKLVKECLHGFFIGNKLSFNDYVIGSDKVQTLSVLTGLYGTQ